MKNKIKFMKYMIIVILCFPLFGFYGTVESPHQGGAQTGRRQNIKKDKVSCGCFSFSGAIGPARSRASY
jgi:hypothetical protein